MIEKRADRHRAVTLGADRGYDTSDFVNELRSTNVRPHVAQRLRGSAIDRRTTRHPGYAKNEGQNRCVRVEGAWMLLFPTISGRRSSRCFRLSR